MFKKTIVFLLLISIINLQGPTLFAAEYVWDFVIPTEYAFDETKIEVSSGHAQLAEPLGWFDSNWLKRQSLGIAGTALGDDYEKTLYDSIGIGLNMTQPSYSLSSDETEIHIAYRDTTTITPVGRFVTYTIDSKTLSTPVQVRSFDMIDPVLLDRGGGVFWIITSGNDKSLYHYESLDSGVTWNLASTIHTNSGTGHYEDLNSVELPNGNLLLTTEWEIADKGNSEIHQVIYDEGTLTWGARTIVFSEDGRDYENPVPFVHSSNSDRVYMLVAYNGVGEETYDENKIYIMHSDDNAITWSVPEVFLEQNSHVEYGVQEVGDEFWMNTTRNYAGNTSVGAISGYQKFPNFTNTQDFTNVWVQDEGMMIINADKSVSMIDKSTERGHFVRDASGDDITVTAMLEAQGTSPGVRVLFGYQDIDNHYVYLAQSPGAGIYKRVAGIYTHLEDVAAVPVQDVPLEVEVNWNRLTGDIEIYVDDVLKHSFNDTTYTTVGKVGLSVGGNALQQPVKAYWIQLENESGVVWYEDWSTYPALQAISDEDTVYDISFLGEVIDAGGTLYAPFENRDDNEIELYSLEKIDRYVTVTLPYDSDMQADFDDIRFTAADGTTELDYSLTSKVDSDTATFVVEVPRLGVDPDDLELFVYYDNDTASSEASGGFPEGIDLTLTAGSEEFIYDANNPIITTNISVAEVSTLLNFTEVATKNSGEITYQISLDSGLTWNWYDTSWKEATLGVSESNTATIINSVISDLPVEGDGEVVFRAYLQSDGATQVQLDQVTLSYDEAVSSKKSSKRRSVEMFMVPQAPSEASEEILMNECDISYLTKDIGFQNKNDSEEVQKLESFLRSVEGEDIAVDGIYKEEDREAVKRFQQKYRSSVLSIWGLSEPTGYVGMTTRLKINNLKCSSENTSCPVFTRYHKFGEEEEQKDVEVKETKKILKDLGYYEGVVDENFDYLLHQSLVIFQESFAATMLEPWGLTSGTGYKYKTTNKFLNYLVGCDTPEIELEGRDSLGY